VLIAGLAMTALAVGWFLVIWHIGTMRDAQVERAGALALAQSRLLLSHAEQVFDGASIALRSLDSQPDVDGIQIDGDPRVVHLRLRELRSASPVFLGIGTVDESGLVSGSADRPEPGRVDLSDRDFFRTLRETPRRDLLIGAPVISRPDEVLSIPVSMALTDTEGRFRGMVAARLAPSAFEALYLSAGTDAVCLFLADGTALIDIGPGSVGKAGRFSPGTLPDDAEGVMPLAGPDGSPVWLAAYSRSARYPILVVVGADTLTQIAVAERREAPIVYIALAATALLLGLSAMLLVRVRRQRKLAEELAAARDLAEAERLSAEAANRSKSEFLAHMSHELRTPLNAINGFAELLAGECFGPHADARYREYADIIHSSGGHLLGVINTILDMAKVDAGKWEVMPEAVALDALVTDMLALTVGRAQASGVRIVTDVPGDLPMVVTDRRLLLQILINLATNAIKFTPSGGEVRIAARAGDKSIHVVVSDDGCGMSPEDLVRLREPFRRGSSEQGRAGHETGLGLPLCLRFADLIGGRLDFDSAPGKGTQVTLRVPFETDFTLAPRFAA